MKNKVTKNDILELIGTHPAYLSGEKIVIQK